MFIIIVEFENKLINIRYTNIVVIRSMGGV